MTMVTMEAVVTVVVTEVAEEGANTSKVQGK